ncbi:hypothetical protein ASPZODRAFT_153743 [Penicilliopsis zonata CBS 506.65]|uniref:Ras-GEF domain-containing protein n=1 Tax=Penicilliopsis zonata CBS 506.65 TaxID=1073090 RepID=A0A1L9SAS6_9EURO|nr:hypothetical protein ASPZODRAFT_153743 [Penicilliopsis zonata CBS 506.65]OJJ44264.1 hypothetical protein ASPZODRAFT_153743 [Penicilliopsis zonata CBS 506.65]
MEPSTSRVGVGRGQPIVGSKEIQNNAKRAAGFKGEVVLGTTLRRAHTVTQGTSLTKRNHHHPVAGRSGRDRTVTSLLRVKDSHELLRQRPLPDAAKSPPREREAKHFTVGNVGHNGRIYLRPVENHPQNDLRPQPFSPVSPQSKDHNLSPLSQDRKHDDPSRWSNSQLSELRPSLLPEDTGDDDAKSILSASDVRSLRRQRAHSFSTVSEHPSSSVGANPPGEFRIVIDRSDDRPRSADGPSSHPNLDVSIPHYALDSPRFNPHGSAIMRSSLHTAAGQMGSSIYSQTNRDSLTPLPGMLPRDSLRPGRPSFAASMLSGTGGIDLSRCSRRISGKSVFYTFKAPVEPSIFEALVSEMDNPAVVRYIPGTKDLSAATPARIVAQISSESFMDYELVSDFFLTFRSYLSPRDLLMLLLARFQWAIGRLQEDGRIIRIRTFAALRHWILNYFLDDFVPNEDIRISFCDTINRMYEEVKAREGGGRSDLKILVDLKRCWHGRCVLYWDVSDLETTQYRPEAAIVPGGSAPPAAQGGARSANWVLQRFSQHIVVQTEPTPGAAGCVDLVLNNVEQDPAVVALHNRKDSSVTAQSVPVSTASGQSAVVTSCSLPSKSPKRRSSPRSSGMAPHPVPLLPIHVPPVPPMGPEPPVISPTIARKHALFAHAHKRSGSFSDSVRDDRSPQAASNAPYGDPSSLKAGGPRSLIRGQLFPPAESYMAMMAPPSPPLPTSVNNSRLDRRSTMNVTTAKSGLGGTSGSGVGVKTIIGSIRRALHQRTGGGQSMSARAVNVPTAPPPPTRGRTSALPANVAFGSELYRGRRATSVPQRPLRIDTLCDQVLKQYRLVTGQLSGQEDPAGGDNPNHNTHFEPSPNSFPEAADSKFLLSRPLPGARILSQVTAGSQSIVIVDDTGLNTPVMSGAVVWPTEEGWGGGPSQQSTAYPGDPSFPSGAASLRPPSHVSTEAADAYTLPIYYDSNGHPQSLYPPGAFSVSSSQRRSYSAERGMFGRKRTSLSLRLRKYASFQSGISRHRLSMQSEKVPSVAEASIESDASEKLSGPTLRRRAGGDLRRMHDGKDSDSQAGRESYPFDLSPRHSFVGSTATGPEDRLSVRQPSLVALPPAPRYSLIRTHSSQHMRPSFEAAIAQFAQIPDDEDGGIESALLKLEGKWKPSNSPAADDSKRQEPEQWLEQQGLNRQDRSSYTDSLPTRRQTFNNSLAYAVSNGRLAAPRPYSDSIAESEESYNSIPLLERGLSDESMKKPDVKHVTPTYAARSRLSGLSSRATSDRVSSNPSFDVVRETESLRCIPRGSTLPVARGGGSYLEGSERCRSELSSDLSVDIIDRQEALATRLSFDTQSLSNSAPEIPPHPLAQPPSPPMTVQHPRSFSSCASPLNPVLFQANPLTPDPSPVHHHHHHHHAGGRNLGRSIEVQQVSSNVLLNSERDCRYQCTQEIYAPTHVPFILACESQVLAQQLTLIEKDALGEIDWRDLVDMRWSNRSPVVQDWVQCLSEEDRRGIDLVVGRFNLMVKWVLSEIVLTQEIQERARTVTKFIHTAVHAKRMCNYATMLQITIALSSTDCSRLRETWALVSAEDRRVFRDLESLIQPVRNFHDLRMEMETANLQEGCIPFVGLYLHDLTYNAQKPAQIASTRDSDPLVNFERYRTAARIVKSLLRLIDASTKYTFEPVPGIIERCLWIGSLSEEQIQARSKVLE